MALSIDSFVSEPIPDTAPQSSAAANDPLLQTIEDQSTPIHSFDYAPLEDLTKERDALATMWLSRNIDHNLPAIEARAKEAGLSLDDVIASAEEKMPFDQRWATKLYRNGGPVFRAGVNSAGSTVTLLTNLAYRGLSNVPGWEHLATKADEQNRTLSTTQAAADILNREGSVADIITPTGASLLGSASEGLFDIATVGAATGGAGVVAEGAGAAEIAAASKAAQLSAAKKAAIYFGLKSSEQALTVGTDQGLSPNMRLANAAVVGSINATFTYGFGQWATKLGLSTAEQAIMEGSPAVERLVQRTGLAQAASSMVLSGGEQAAMEASQIGWGSVVGTDNRTSDERWAGVIRAAGVGVAMRGAAEILPGHKSFQDAYIKTQEALPDTVKGTLDAQKAVESGSTPVLPENASENYKAAFQSEIDALNARKEAAHGELANIKLGEQSLKQQVDEFIAAKADINAIDAELVSKDIKANRDELVAKRKGAELRLKEIEQALDGLTEAQKDAAKAQVIEKLETSKTAAKLEQGRVNLTRAENALNEQFRAQEGYAALPETDRISLEQSLRNARASGLVTRADEIANDVVTTKRGISSDEQAGLLDASLQRAAIIERATKTANDATLSDSVRNDAVIEAQEARTSADLISQALNEGATDPARMLAHRRLEIDNLNPANVREYARRVKGGELTGDESNGFTSDSVKLTGIRHRARLAKDGLANSEGQPLTEAGFALRETLRAEQAKGSPLSKSEAADVAARAKTIYQNSGDIARVDRELQQNLANDLYVDGVHARAALELKIKSLEPRTAVQQAGKYASFANSLWRAWETGGDFFPFFRQGITEPITSTRKGIPVFFKSLFSERNAILEQRTIKEDAYYPTAINVAKVAIMEADAPFAMREGTMLDAAHEALPFLGNFQRAFRVSLNKVRLEVFKAQVNSKGGLAKWDTSNLLELGKFVNNGTGRGTLPGFEQSASTLSKIMIGPRFFVSRLTYMTPLQLFTAAYKGNKMAVSVMLTTYAKQIAGLAVMTAFAEQAGKAAFGDDAVEFHRNPLDFDFGRLRVGSTMIDITGGLARPYRYATSIFEPMLAKAADRKALKRTGPTILGIVRGQLAPLPSALVSAGEVYMGRKQAGAEATNYIVPWSWNDSVKAVMNEGFDKGSAIAALNMFGAGSYSTERQ